MCQGGGKGETVECWCGREWRWGEGWTRGLAAGAVKKEDAQKKRTCRARKRGEAMATVASLEMPFGSA